MAKIKNASDGIEFEVWCQDCKKVIIVEGPEDLRKKFQPGEKHPMFCLVCPECGREIWFDGILGHTLSPEFMEQVKIKE